MSLLIKGMEMPKDCPYCPMSHWNKRDEFTGCDIVSGKKYTLFNNKEYANSSTRPDWCPLIEIPDKHGRLIDADALESNGWYLMRVNIKDGKYEAANLMIAPTIIPAEEGE